MTSMEMQNYENQPLPINLSQTKQQMNISIKPNDIAKNINDLRNIRPKEIANNIKMEIPIKFNIQGTSITGKEIQKNYEIPAKVVVTRNINLGKNICK